MSNHIVVLAEAREGALKKASLETVSAARELASQAGGQVVVVLAGKGLDNAVAELGKSGADRVIAIDSPVLEHYSGDGYCRALVEQVKPLTPTAVLMAHTAMGKDLAPRVAAALETGLASDVTALHVEDGKLGATRPVFAGKAYQKVMADRTPFMATVRPNNFEVGSGDGAAETTTAQPSFGPDELKALVTEVVASASGRVPLQEAQIVVSGGRGLKEPEHFKLVEELAAAFGEGRAAVGASRAVVDAGWRPHREQVGQTGKVVAPTLYIACGISGAIQHLAGMRTARYIVAINKDPEAPIFKVANYGIVGDVFEVLPALTDAVKAASAG
ncbi:MAG: electron transfer flavoprotein subunit alpha/FixB family protein [Planctomycetota bacterium]